MAGFGVAGLECKFLGFSVALPKLVPGTPINKTATLVGQYTLNYMGSTSTPLYTTPPGFPLN